MKSEHPTAAPRASWQRNREGGWRWLLRVYVWLVLRLGRRFGRSILVLVCAYFFLVRRAERHASREYLRRVLDREPGWRDVARHFWVFSQNVMDRAFLIGMDSPPLAVEAEGLERLREYVDAGRGVLLLGAHFGSFEACRLISRKRTDLSVRVLMDRGRGANTNPVVEALNPDFARQIIDIGAGGDRAVLIIREALDAGDLVGVLGDRMQPGERRRSTVDFLGGKAEIPQSPYLIAALTGAPVMLIFGVFEGGNRYRVIFEPFAERIELPRGNRRGAIAQWAQHYADRLEARVREYPYNWFNFYDFWAHS